MMMTMKTMQLQRMIKLQRAIQLNKQHTKLSLVVLLFVLLATLSSCAITEAEYAAYHKRHSQQDTLLDGVTLANDSSANKGLLVASITREISALGKRGAIAFFFVRNKKTGVEFEMSSNPESTDGVDHGINNKSLSYQAIVDTLDINKSMPNETLTHGVINKVDQQTPLALASKISNTQDQEGSVLAFELEPGIYEISKWKVITSGGMDFADFDAEGHSPIAFEVKSGEVSYLCNCHITVDMGENIFGDAVEDGAEAAIYDKMQRDMQYVDEKYPSLSELKVNNIAANLRVTESSLAP